VAAAGGGSQPRRIPPARHAAVRGPPAPRGRARPGM